jgi:hypothetical protein
MSCGRRSHISVRVFHWHRPGDGSVNGRIGRSNHGLIGGLIDGSIDGSIAGSIAGLIDGLIDGSISGFN